MVKINQSQLEEMAALYYAGETTWTLAARYNVTQSAVMWRLKKFGVKLRPLGPPVGTHTYCGKTTKTQVAEMIDLYNQGSTIYELGEIFGVRPGSIFSMLKRHKVKLRSAAENHRTYACNHNFFSEINPTTAYWAGFIAGDGNIFHPAEGKGKACLAIGLAMQDRDHLLKLKNLLGSEHPLRVGMRKQASHQDNITLRIASEQLAKDLLTHYNIGPNKSLTYEWPGHLPTDILWHFLRGLFDADGSYIITDRETQRIRHLMFTIVGSRACMTALQQFLMKECDLTETALYQEKRTHHIDTVNVRYSGRLQVKTIFDHLYKDATYWLERKKDKIEPFLEIERDWFKKISDADEVIICSLYQQGRSTYQLADQFHVHQGSISNCLARKGITMRSIQERTQLALSQLAPNALRKLNDEQIDQVCALYAKGMFPDEIAKQFSVSGTSIRDYLKKRGVYKPGQSATIPDAQILEIRLRYAQGNITFSEMAKVYGLHKTTISRIVKRKTRNSIP